MPEAGEIGRDNPSVSHSADSSLCTREPWFGALPRQPLCEREPNIDLSHIESGAKPYLMPPLMVRACRPTTMPPLMVRGGVTE